MIGNVYGHEGWDSNKKYRGCCNSNKKRFYVMECEMVILH